MRNKYLLQGLIAGAIVSVGLIGLDSLSVKDGEPRVTYTVSGHFNRIGTRNEDIETVVVIAKTPTEAKEIFAKFFRFFKPTDLFARYLYNPDLESPQFKDVIVLDKETAK